MNLALLQVQARPVTLFQQRRPHPPEICLVMQRYARDLKPSRAAFNTFVDTLAREPGAG